MLGFIDYYHQILPDAVTMPGLVLALVYAFFRDDLTFRGALLGAVLGPGSCSSSTGPITSSGRRRDWAWAT